MFGSLWGEALRHPPNPPSTAMNCFTMPKLFYYVLQTSFNGPLVARPAVAFLSLVFPSFHCSLGICCLMLNLFNPSPYLVVYLVEEPKHTKAKEEQKHLFLQQLKANSKNLQSKCWARQEKKWQTHFDSHCMRVQAKDQSWPANQFFDPCGQGTKDM